MESSTNSPTEKLRLMCSYGGRIIPRPHDKSLFYAGGETRLIAVSRKAAFSVTSLTAHLSKTFQISTSQQQSPSFSIKYQLPDNDLDSLISISTDEDLANMLDEYDRLSANPTPSRIRFFIFVSDGGELSGSGLIRSHPKTEDWLIDALRSSGSGSGSGSGLAESVSVEDRGGGGREREEDSSFGSNGSSSYPPTTMARAGSGGDIVVGGGAIKVMLPSVDSLGSNDSSIPSPNFSPQAIDYQDASVYPGLKTVSTNHVENESHVSDRFPQSDILTPVKVPGYILTKPIDHPPQTPSPPPQQSQQYIHHPFPQPHYINQYYPNSIPVPSYPTMYSPYIQTQQPVQYHQVNKPYPMYMMPIGQGQNPYAVPQTMTHNQPQIPSNPVMVAPQMVYEGYNSPNFASNVYRPTTVVTQPVKVAKDDSHHQVVALSPQAPPSQPVTGSPRETQNYIAEYEDPMHGQIYKSQPTGPTLPSQIHTTTMAETQLQVENTKQ